MDNLPPSVLVQIFSHLEVKDKCSVARVCKYWRELVGERRIWKNVNFSPCRVDLPARWGALRRYFTDGLHTLHLRGFVFTSRSKTTKCLNDAILKHILRRCPNIVELHIDEADLSNVDSGNLPPTLEVLALCRCKTTPGWFQAGVTKGRLDRLWTLNLEKSKDICDKDMEDIALLSEGGKLECLNISYCYRVTERSCRSLDKLNLWSLIKIGTYITYEKYDTVLPNTNCLLSSDMDRHRVLHVPVYIPQAYVQELTSGMPRGLSSPNYMDRFSTSCLILIVVIVGFIMMYAYILLYWLIHKAFYKP